jgi:hypothetical protein
MGQAELLIAGVPVAVAGLSVLARRLSVPYRGRTDDVAPAIPLAGLAVAGRPLDDDVDAAVGVDEGVERHHAASWSSSWCWAALAQASSVTPPAASAAHV